MTFYLNFILLLSSIPTGLIIAWLARDELIDGYIYLKIFFGFSLILMSIFSFVNEVATISLGFVCIVTYISIIKRNDNKWAVERKR